MPAHARNSQAWANAYDESATHQASATTTLAPSHDSIILGDPVTWFPGAYNAFVSASVSLVRDSAKKFGHPLAVHVMVGFGAVMVLGICELVRRLLADSERR